MPRILAALALFAFTAIWLLGGRGGLGVPGQWVLTPNARPWPFGAWLLPVAVLVIFGGAAALSTYDRFARAKSPKEQRNSTLTALFCLALLVLLWPWSLLGPGAINQNTGRDTNGRSDASRLTLEGRFNIIAAMWSDVATEYFGVAYQISDARQFGREYASKYQHPTSPAQAHVATHPPGATLLFYGARRIYEAAPPLQNGFESLAATLTQQKNAESVEALQLLRTAVSRGARAPDPPPLPASALGGALWTALLLGLSLVLAVPAVYGLAAAGSEGAVAEARGLFAVALWVLAPTINLFAFTLDAPIAAGTVWTLFFAAKSLSSEAKTARKWMIGAGISLALTSFLSLGALAAGLILVIALAKFRRDVAAPRLLELGAAFAAVWLILALAFGFNPLEIVSNALAAHRFATLGTRTLAPWSVMNLVTFAVFAGFGAFVCWFRRDRPASVAAQIGLATLAAMILLSLSGNVRGEVERLWLFLAAPVAVYAACADLPPRVSSALLIVQAAQTLLMAATLGPLVRP
jgi:hypothetical protein